MTPKKPSFLDDFSWFFVRFLIPSGGFLIFGDWLSSLIDDLEQRKTMLPGFLMIPVCFTLAFFLVKFFESLKNVDFVSLCWKFMSYGRPLKEMSLFQAYRRYIRADVVMLFYYLVLLSAVWFIYFIGIMPMEGALLLSLVILSAIILIEVVEMILVKLAKLSSKSK